MNSKAIVLCWLGCLLLLAGGAGLAAEANFSEQLARASNPEKAALLNEWAYSLRNKDYLLSFEKAGEALRWAEKTGDREQKGWALALIGLSQCFRGEQAAAEKNLLAALSTFKKIGALKKELQALNWLGILQYQRGDYDKALDLYGLARDRAESLGEEVIKADTLTNIAIILDRQGHFKKAMENFLEAIDIYEERKVNRKIPVNLINIGIIYSRLRIPDKALEYYRTALQKAREFGSENDEALALTNIGVCIGKQGQREKAEAYYLEALAIRRKAKAVGKIAHLLICLSISSRDRGSLDQAQGYLDEAQELLDRNNLDYLKGTFLLEKSGLMLQKKDYYRAIAAAQEAVEELKKTEVITQEIQAYLLLSEIYSELGDDARALANYRLFQEKAAKFTDNLTGSQVLDLDFRKRKEKMDHRFHALRKDRSRVLWGGIVTALILVLALIGVLLGRNSLKRRSQYLLSLKENEISEAKSSMQWMMGELKEYLALKNRRRYEKSTLSDEEAEAIVAALKQRMEAEQEYVNPDLNLAALAGMIGCSAKELSQVINGRFHMNFNDYVNSYRVDFAKKKLAAEANLSILDIAFEAGFNSKTSFNISFKKLTGLTPRQFRRQHAGGS